MKNDKVPRNEQIVAFNLPYPAEIVNGVLVIAVPLGNGAPLFTEPAVESTCKLLGTVGGETLLDDIRDEYYQRMVRAQMTPAKHIQLPASDHMRLFPEPAPKGWDKV